MSTVDHAMSQPNSVKEVFRSIPCLLIAFLITVSVLIPFLAVLMYEVVYMQRVHAGVSMGGVDLSGLTPGEAEAKLERTFENYAEEAVTLRYGDRVWFASARELGMTYDPRLTSEEAYRVGRGKPIVESLKVHLDSLLNGHTIRAVRSFNDGDATMYLSKLANDINLPARDAKIVIDGFRVWAEPARIGYELDIPATRSVIESALTNLSQEPVAVVVREIHPAVVDVETAKTQVANILAKPLMFVFREQNFVGDTPEPQVVERRWVLDRASLAEMMISRQVKNADGSVSLVMGLDTSKLSAYFQGLAAQINRPARDAQLDFDPETGVLTPLAMSQEGYSLDIEQATALANAQVVEPNREIVLPVHVTRPAVAVESIPQMGIKELVSEATTSFKGSSVARVHNIQVAASRFDGVVIAPGEEFSFNDRLGEVSAATGYEESQIIWGDRTAIGIGGGVCQVSTTAFRAAFWAGLPVLERYNHGYRVSWYEPPVGMDATVYAPVVDLKFKNDMAAYILIKTEIDVNAATLTFRFYGSNQGRIVEMSGPVESNKVPHGSPVYQDDPTLAAGTEKQVEWPHDGVDVIIERTVFENGSVILADRFFSRYTPWPAVYLRGTRGTAVTAGTSMP